MMKPKDSKSTFFGEEAFSEILMVWLLALAAQLPKGIKIFCLQFCGLLSTLCLNAIVYIVMSFIYKALADQEAEADQQTKENGIEK